MTVCERCGTENPDGFRFCGGCGAPLAARLPPRQVRKVVTALFCDVTGSTALGEELDPEVLRGVMNRYFTEIRATIERHGGTVEKFIGDAVMAVFGIPRVHEDDALRAVRAAADIRDRLPAIAGEVGVALRFRTGINTGAVLTGEGENLAIGDAVNVAARLEQAAAPGEIVLGPDTLALVRDAVEVEPLEPLSLRGKSEPIDAFRLLRVDPEAAGVARHLEAPLVGRRRELALLTQAWQRAVDESDCHLFTLLGPAGVGKSRLVAELLSEVDGAATLLRGRCLHYGEGITFWPLVEALMPAGEVAKSVLERLTATGAATAEELFWEVRRLLETLASTQPVILHIDDMHWAEPMLLDLLDHVTDLSKGAPILLLCTARPELLEDRPGWGGGKLNASAVLLQPLAAAESEALLDQLGDGLDAGARARVIAASEGNPLFLEEMVALARERGTVAVPASIQALLAARLERLADEERELLERGAIEGEVFHRLAIRALAGERLAAEVEIRLAGLVRKELIRPHPATITGDEAFRFRHLLIRDAAYDRLPKADRARLHERFARWLEEYASRLAELDEIAGWHLEQAARYREELGQAVERAVSDDAAAHLYSAALRANDRCDEFAARTLLDRALALASREDPIHTQIVAKLAELVSEAGDLARADELLQEAEGVSVVDPMVRLTRLQWLHRARPRESTAIIEQELPGLMAELERRGDERGLATAHLTAFTVHWLQSKGTPAGVEVKLAAEYARRAGAGGLRERALAWYLTTNLYGPANVRTIAALLDELDSEHPGAYLRAFTECGRSAVECFEERYGSARTWALQAKRTFASLGASMEGWGLIYLCYAERAAGDYPAAIAAAVRGDQILGDAGETAFRSTSQAILSELYHLAGDRQAAIAAIALSDELSAPQDSINFAMTHRVRAALARADGDLDGSEQWARSALDWAFRTDFVIDHAKAKLEFARVLAARERLPDAVAAVREAVAIYDAKGDRGGAAQAQALLDELERRA
jgi:class 3 adenylate cyclase